MQTQPTTQPIWYLVISIPGDSLTRSVINAALSNNANGIIPLDDLGLLVKRLCDKVHYNPLDVTNNPKNVMYKPMLGLINGAFHPIPPTEGVYTNYFSSNELG